MSEANLTILGQSLNLVVDTTRARQNLVWLGMSIIALLAAPEPVSGSMSGWLILASIFAAVSLTNIYHARKLEDPRSSLTHLGITFCTGIIAVIISMVIQPLSGMFLLVILGLLAYTSEHRPFVTVAISTIAAPFWIWLAADAWRWQLLMLVVIVALGLLAVSHLLDTHTWPEDEDRVLPGRAHRSAAWMVIALTGVIVILVGLLTGVSRPWLALAGIILAAAIPLEAGVGIDGSGSARPGIRVLTAAYLIVVCCWMIGIE